MDDNGFEEPQTSMAELFDRLFADRPEGLASIKDPTCKAAWVLYESFSTKKERRPPWHVTEVRVHLIYRDLREALLDTGYGPYLERNWDDVFTTRPIAQLEADRRNVGLLVSAAYEAACG